MNDSATLTDAQAAAVADLAGLGVLRDYRLLKRENDVYRLQAVGGTCYLKTYTKSWYGSNVPATAACVRHEAVAYRILRSRGLPAPEVLLASQDMSNPLGRPFILLGELPGHSLVGLLYAVDTARESDALLAAVGAYLARLHEITFRYPGYLMDDYGPQAPVDPKGWLHPVWTAAAAQREALAWLEAEEGGLSRELAAALQNVFSALGATLAPAYDPPRFTHGDCHVGQFFLLPAAGGWRATGVVDMEVASAGDPGWDIAKFAIEMMARFPQLEDWWEPFFAGYGSTPDLEALRLRLLAIGEPSFRAHGVERWPASFERTLSHLLAARDWRGLLTRP